MDGIGGKICAHLLGWIVCVPGRLSWHSRMLVRFHSVAGCLIRSRQRIVEFLMFEHTDRFLSARRWKRNSWGSGYFCLARLRRGCSCSLSGERRRRDQSEQNRDRHHTCRSHSAVPFLLRVLLPDHSSFWFVGCVAVHFLSSVIIAA